LLHAAPQAPAVNIYSDDETLLGESLEFGEFTPYIPIQPGEYEIDVTLVDEMEPILGALLTIPDRVIYTIAVIGTPPNIEIVAIEDPPLNVPVNQVGLRFVHLSPNAPAVDVRLQDDNLLFQDIGYLEAPNYIYVDPSTYFINVYPTGTDENVLQVPNIRLKKDRFYTIYAVGLVGDNPPLQVLIPLDGNSYINV
jgi:hypothetical protein